MGRRSSGRENLCHRVPEGVRLAKNPVRWIVAVGSWRDDCSIYAHCHAARGTPGRAENKAMTKRSVGAIVAALVMLVPGVSAHAFPEPGQDGRGDSRVPGGFGFTGSPGYGFTGPRGMGFTETLGDLRGLRSGNDGPAYGRASGFGTRGIGRLRLSQGDRSGYVKSAVDDLSHVNTILNANANRLGIGWSSPYVTYHDGWVHGYWSGHYSGGLGWRPFAYGARGFHGPGSEGRLGYGPGIGVDVTAWGLSSWMYGPVLYRYGYLGYHNPYDATSYAGNTVAAQRPPSDDYDYSRPINTQSTPPARAGADQAVVTFYLARHAFKRGDNSAALELVERALMFRPDDPSLHEFRALTLFALRRYDEAAAALYAGLSIKPGWDWVTLIGLYRDAASYTQQLRALETFASQSPQSAPAHFVLAWHYLTQEYADAALRQFKLATSVQPEDALSAQMIHLLELPQKVAAARAVQPVAYAAPTGKEGRIAGIWTARPAVDMHIALIFHEGGRYTWQVSRQGKAQLFEGKSSNEKGVLTLVEDHNNTKLVGRLHWSDETHFVFNVMGAGPGDPGLWFTKAS
jgi:tetratricopeptide (TPR) repeat protein